MKQRKLFVTTALPYANGAFHMGHIMEYIQADIWVRHERMCGNIVHFVGADDVHGAPIMIAAQKRGLTPQAASSTSTASISAMTIGGRQIRLKTMSCLRKSIVASRTPA